MNASFPQKKKSSGRMKLAGLLICVLGLASTTNMGVLSTFRRLCEITFEHPWDSSTPEEYWEELYPGVNQYTYDPTIDNSVAPDDTNIAYVLNVPPCDAALACSPGHALYDAAAVLKYGLCSKHQPVTPGSSYTSTMYAFVHPDSITCQGPHGEEYDRVKMLMEMGYKVLIHGNPVHPGQVSSHIDLINDDLGLSDLLTIGAYKLESHAVAVLVDFQTVLTGSIDDTISQFAASSENAYFGEDYTMIKPDKATFDVLTGVYKSDIATMAKVAAPYTGYLGTKGLLAHHFNIDESVPDDSATMLCGVCGAPWDCPDMDTATPACQSAFQSWIADRQALEAGYWTTPALTAVDNGGNFQSSIYGGYCKAQGPTGYDYMIDDKAPTVAPTLAPTPFPTSAPTVCCNCCDNQPKLDRKASCPGGEFTYVIDYEALPWDGHNAKALADPRNCQLASFQTAEEWAPAKAILDAESQNQFWMGGLRVGQECGVDEWSWSDGSCYTYESWNPGEPNDYGGSEDHMQYRGGNWNDLPGPRYPQPAIYQCCSA